MAKKNYSSLIAKIILWHSRVFGITFGGIQIKNFAVSGSHTPSSQFSIKTNKKLRIVGFVISLIILAYSVYSLAKDINKLNNETRGTIIDAIYLTGISIVHTHYCVYYFISHFYGYEIFLFLSSQKLNKKQFWLCLLSLVLPVVYVIAINLADLYESTWVFSAEKNAINQIIFFFFEFLWAPAVTIRILVSLMAFWSIKDITVTLSKDGLRTGPRQEFDIILSQICKEFVELQDSFDKLDSVLAFLNLSNFPMFTTFLLMDVFIIVNGKVLVGLTELFGGLFVLVGLCFVHDLPHKACKDLLKNLDKISVLMPPRKAILQANMVLSRDSVGFKLLGHNYDLSLLSAVSAYYDL